MLTHANLAANALQLRHWAPEMRAGVERVLAVIPFSHSYGITACVNISALIGATLILLPRFDVVETLKTIAREKPSVFPGVPLMFQNLAHFPDVRKYGVASIRLCVSSGSPLPVEVQEEFEKLTRGRVVEAYGLTEASPATHANPFAGRRRPGAIGLPLPDTEAKVIDPDTGETVAPETAGELVLRGPQVMQGYWNRPEETAKALRDGWLYTGDICKMDEDGYFYVIDRKKDIIFTAGYPVYPRDIEEVLYEHPGVLEAAVVGVPDWDEALSIRAFVVRRDHAKVTADELMAHAKRRLPPYALPATLEFVNVLPRNALGKVLRRELAMREAKAE
jgi:long-chain acyl-CoA synthetase